MHDCEKIESTINKHSLIEALQGIVSGESLLFETEDLKPYECDGLSA